VINYRIEITIDRSKEENTNHLESRKKEREVIQSR